MDKHCEQVLETLWTAEAALGPEAPGVLEARRHVAECAACRDWLRRDSVLTGRIRDLRVGGATPCRGDMRESILRALEEHPVAAGSSARAGQTAATPGDAGSGPGAQSGVESHGGMADRFRARVRRWPAWTEGLVAAAAATILIAGGLTLSRSLDSGLSNEAIVADFHRQALPEIVRRDLPRAEVEAFYAAQFPGEGPKLMIDAPVTKVGVCNLEGRMGVMVEYDWSGSRLVYYQVPRDRSDSPGDSMRKSRDGDLNVVRWGDARYDYILVSAMPPESMEQLARQHST